MVFLALTRIFYLGIFSLLMLTRKQLVALRHEKPAPNRVASARKLAGLTQTELAERLGCAQPNVSRIERGLCPEITLDTTMALADVFGCQIYDLFPSREAVSA